MADVQVIAPLAKWDALNEQHSEMHGVLVLLVEIIEKAGLSNLSNGVQLGPTVWYVKASDILNHAKDVLNKIQLQEE